MRFTSTISRDSNSNWKCVVWNDSVKELKTGKSVKVKAIVNITTEGDNLIED